MGTPLFWLTIAVTVCAAVPFALFPTHARVAGQRGTADVDLLFHRQRRAIAPDAFGDLGAGVSARRRRCSRAARSGLIEVQIWMVWVLGAGIIAANLSERFIGKYSVGPAGRSDIHRYAGADDLVLRAAWRTAAVRNSAGGLRSWLRAGLDVERRTHSRRASNDASELMRRRRALEHWLKLDGWVRPGRVTPIRPLRHLANPQDRRTSLIQLVAVAGS